jgi:hypothetical protein
MRRREFIAGLGGAAADAGAPLKSMKATVPPGVENSYFS